MDDSNLKPLQQIDPDTEQEQEEEQYVYMETDIPEDLKLNGAFVTDIYWERINLYLKLRVEFADPAHKEDTLDFFLVNRFGMAGGRFEIIEKDGNSFLLRMNISNPGSNLILNAGNYYIYVCKGTYILSKAFLDPSSGIDLQDASRSFLYRNRSYSYVIEFLENDSPDGLPVPLTMLVMAGEAIAVGSMLEHSGSSMENLIM